MGQPLLLPPELDESVTRIRTTDAGTLRRAADALDATSRTASSVSRSLGAGAMPSRTEWRGAAADAFQAYEATVRGRLEAVHTALGVIASALRSHAAVADEVHAEADLGLHLAAALPPAALGSTDSPWTDAQQRRNDILRLLHRAAGTFQASERAMRAVLWSLGEQAPYGIPLPELPPPAPRSWWQTALIGPADVQYWTAANGLRVAVDAEAADHPAVDTSRFDPAAPLYGADEDGNLVPAFMADPSVGTDELLENGPSVGAMLGFIARGAKAARTVEAATNDMSALIQRSHGWRPDHMDRHIREFYRLKGGAVPEAWHRADFLRIISAAGARQGKVFTWRVPYDKGGTQATYAVLYNDPGTKRWLVVQFYKEGRRAREFATAFIPTEAQQAAMLKEIAITS